MAAKLGVRLMLALLCVNSVCSQVLRKKNNKKPEGMSCNTPHVTDGICMNVANCDQAFIYSLPYEEHTPVCKENAFYKVVCCQSFLDYCENRKAYHIWNGIEADPGAFPYLARLGDNNDDSEIPWKCSANVISEQFLLTAAHCRSAHVAGFGCRNDTDCDQLIPVKKFVTHPLYKSPAKYHDIALVHLRNVIQFNRRVLPICPDQQTIDLQDYVNLTIAGWGQTENRITSLNLMKTTVRTVPFEKCHELYAEFPDVILNRTMRNGLIGEQYCAQGFLAANATEYSDACQGDSGGPLLADGQTTNSVYLIGVISTGFGCGSQYPGLYTRVGAYLSWIRKTIETPDGIM